MNVHPPEAINWKRVLKDAEPPNLTGPPKEQGWQFHRWVQTRFESKAVPFERDLDWLTGAGEPGGRFDCFDGFYVYEFKTVTKLPSQPRPGDVEQVRRYLAALDAEFGLVVYVARAGFEVEHFHVER